MIEFLKNWWFLIMLLTIASIGVFVWLFLNRSKLNAKWWEILIITILHTVIGVGTVKFWALLEAGFNTSKAGNMSLFGGIFIMPLFYFIYAKIKKISVAKVFSLFSVCLAFTLLCARINCLRAGCCYGIEIGNSGFRVPTREIELFYYCAFLIFSIDVIWKDKEKVNSFVIFILSYGVVRFISQWFRYSENGNLFQLGHIWALCAFSIGLSLLLIQIKKLKNKEIKDE